MIRWRPKPTPRMWQWVDWIVAIALSIDVVAEALFASGITGGHRAVTAVFAVAYVAPVALRRRWPAAAVVAVPAVLILQEPFGGQVTDLATGSFLLVPVLVSYGAGAWLPVRRSTVAIVLAMGLQIGDGLVGSFITHTEAIGGVSGVLQAVVYPMLCPWLAGRFIRARQQHTDAIRALAAQVAREQAEREQEAIATERLVIGRELQDIIAHDVSIMVIQAAAARQLVRRDPERARDAILAVEATGREALAEVRRLLGLLRKDDDPRALAPQPGIEQLPDLTDSWCAAGLACHVQTAGTPMALTPGINLVGYRVVEATLADAAEGGCSQATATVRYAPERLDLEIDGDRPLSGFGSGLTTVAERVRLYGGSLNLAAVAGGFAVRCRLPLERTDAG